MVNLLYVCRLRICSPAWLCAAKVKVLSVEPLRGRDGESWTKPTYFHRCPALMRYVRNATVEIQTHPSRRQKLSTKRSAAHSLVIFYAFSKKVKSVLYFFVLCRHTAQKISLNSFVCAMRWRWCVNAACSQVATPETFFNSACLPAVFFPAFPEPEDFLLCIFCHLLW